MHTVELLDRALKLAAEYGFVVRQESLGGASSGVCQLKGRRMLLVDVSLSASEQLEIVLSALRGEPDAALRANCSPLRHLLETGKAA